MDTERKNFIYDRLLQISLKIDLQAIPDPGYINEKIWECHRYIEEIEKFNIQVSKEISVIQQALNNKQAFYDSKKEDLILSSEIMKLPSIKDREARANNLLRDPQKEIKEYENELTDLNNLLKVTTLKIKNLNRANGDIRTLLRCLEAQLRMSGPGVDKTNRGLIEELSKSTIGEDSFKNVEVVEHKQEIIDPSSPMDMKDILDIPDNVIEPIPDFEEDEIENDEPWIPKEEIPSDPEPEQKNQIINLDDVLTEKSNQTKKEVAETKTEPEDTTQKSVSNRTGVIDGLDDLLDSII